MVTLQMFIFNVDRGFSCFIRSPTNETLMVDCGCREDFSPAEYIYENLLLQSEKNNVYKITQLVVSHPHDDHINDVTQVHEILHPNMLLGRKYEWDDLKEPNLDYENLDYYLI